VGDTIRRRLALLAARSIGTAGGINLYAYVGNNPLNKSDPMGTDQGDPCPDTDLILHRHGFKGSGGAGLTELIGLVSSDLPAHG